MHWIRQMHCWILMRKIRFIPPRILCLLVILQQSMINMGRVFRSTMVILSEESKMGPKKRIRARIVRGRLVQSPNG
jgi:hypothetical protein